MRTVYPARCLVLVGLLLLLHRPVSVAFGALTTAVEARPAPARVGERLAVPVHVTNTGPAAVNVVTVELAIPVEVDAFNETLADGGSCNGE